ncbi:TPA: hypothetical protein QFM42_002492, partial [Enterococcus faecium]
VFIIPRVRGEIKSRFLVDMKQNKNPHLFNLFILLKDRLNVDRSRLSSLFHFEKKLTACFFYGILARKRIRIMR